MPHFDEFGGDMWMCQVCGKEQNSRVQSTWRPDITGSESAGNVCPVCLKHHENKTKPECYNFKIVIGNKVKYAYTFQEAVIIAKEYGTKAVISRNDHASKGE